VFDSLCLFGLLNFPMFWLAIPLAVAFSLVYAATRCEEPREICKRALSVACKLFFFLILVGVVLHFAV